MPALRARSETVVPSWRCAKRAHSSKPRAAATGWLQAGGVAHVPKYALPRRRFRSLVEEHARHSATIRRLHGGQRGGLVGAACAVAGSRGRRGRALDAGVIGGGASRATPSVSRQLRCLASPGVLRRLRASLDRAVSLLFPCLRSTRSGSLAIRFSRTQPPRRLRRAPALCSHDVALARRSLPPCSRPALRFEEPFSVA